MAEITPQKVSDGLANVAFAAASGGGDTVPAGVELGGWSLPVVLLVDNDDASSHEVTVGDLPAITVAAGDLAAIQVNGGVAFGKSIPVTYDGVTAVTVAALDLSE